MPNIARAIGVTRLQAAVEGQIGLVCAACDTSVEAIDYRKLLTKYMGLVIEHEGVDFLYSRTSTDSPEMVELHNIAEEAEA